MTQLIHATLFDDRRYSVNPFYLVSILEADDHAALLVAGEIIEVQETWGDLVEQYARLDGPQYDAELEEGDTLEGIPLIEGPPTLRSVPSQEQSPEPNPGNL